MSMLKKFQPNLLLPVQFTWQHLVDIQQIPAALQPPNVSIHRPVRVIVKGTELSCYSGIDEQVIRKKNMGETFMTQLSPAMLNVDPKNLQSIRQLKFNPVNYNRGDKMIKKLLWNISTLIKITCSVSC